MRNPTPHIPPLGESSPTLAHSPQHHRPSALCLPATKTGNESECAWHPACLLSPPVLTAHSGRARRKTHCGKWEGCSADTGPGPSRAPWHTDAPTEEHPGELLRKGWAARGRHFRHGDTEGRRGRQPLCLGQGVGAGSEGRAHHRVHTEEQVSVETLRTGSDWVAPQSLEAGVCQWV